MLFVIGLVSRIPAHFCGVHAGKVFVFAVAAQAAFTDSVVQFAAFVFDLVDSKALADVSAMDDQTLGHA